MEDSILINKRSTEIYSMDRKKGKVLVQTSLYSEDCLALLQQALAEAGTTSAAAGENKRLPSKSRYASSSSSDEEVVDEDTDSDGSGDDPGESSSDEATGERTKSAASISSTRVAPPRTDTTSPNTVMNKNKIKIEKFTKRQSDIQVRKHVDTLTCHNFLLRDPADSGLCLPSAVLSKDDRLAEHPSVILEAFRQLSMDVQQTGKPVIVFFVRSGRFAGAVFVGGECVQHRTTTRYTIRKGQGKAQSAQDSQRRAKSIGSQLRRQGEEKLQEDITETATAWRAHVDKAALFLVSCPKTMKKNFYESLDGIISRDDSRIRRVPLDLGRPTFENAVLIHDVLCTVTVREMIPTSTDEVEDSTRQTVDNENQGAQSPREKDETVVVDIPLSALHVACKNGDLEVIREILAADTKELTVMAGPDLMTPLHYAAASSSSVDHQRRRTALPNLWNRVPIPAQWTAAHVHRTFWLLTTVFGMPFASRGPIWERTSVTGNLPKLVHL